MTEQIITNLSQLQKLKVIARTSVMKFKNTQKTIPEIAKELGVATILEGSVRKAGNRIRVTAQLIHAEGGHHLWAKDYNRELADIFAVQDDVSQAIAGALLEKLALGEVEKLKHKQTESVEAYQNYLKGVYFHRKYNLALLEENAQKSEELFKKAIELDPNYALAYAGLADLYNSLSWGSKDDKYGKLQQEYIEIAFKLDPNSAVINLVKSSVHSYRYEIDDSYKSLKRVLELNPNDRGVIRGMGVFLSSRGLHHQAIKYFTKAIELDPLVPSGYSWRGLSFERIGAFDRAMADYQTGLELSPDFFILLGMTARLFIAMKKYDKAELLLAKCKDVNPNALSNEVFDAFLFAAKGMKQEALQAIERGGHAVRKIHKLKLYSLLGLTEEAIKMLREKPYSDDITRRHVDLEYLDMLHNPVLDNIRDTEEFQAALQKAKGMYDENLRKYEEVFLHD